MKKLTALLLALVMVLAMNATAFAVADLPANGKVTSSEETLKIKKEIAFFAPNGTEIQYPAISYSYAIAPATGADGTITDDDGDTANVKVGVAGAVTMGADKTAVFNKDKVVASANGALVSDEFEITVDASQFDYAGIYRYELTESIVGDMAELGYVAANGANKEHRYLDVYIGYNNSDPAALEVKGYVLFRNATPDKTFTPATEGTKTEGFVHEGSDLNYKDDEYVDKYSAYNVTITKKVTGTMGDKSNEFPFYAAISDAPVSSDIVITVAGGTVAELAELASGEVAKTEIAALADSETVTIKGIPVNATVTINENNNTAATYVVSTEGLTGGPTGNVTGNTDSGAGTVTSADVDTKAVTFTNNLDDVSQTGVVLRFAPYALMLGAGVALFIILKVRKNKAVDEA